MNAAARAAHRESRRRLSAKEVSEIASGNIRKIKHQKLTEKAVQSACMDILERHPRVAFWWRQNTGAVKLEGAGGKNRYVRFSFKGASDLMAVLVGGKFLAVECKATGKEPSDDQRAFLRRCNEAHAYGVWVDDPQQLIDYLS
jgi:hypothetical protein